MFLYSKIRQKASIYVFLICYVSHLILPWYSPFLQSTFWLFVLSFAPESSPVNPSIYNTTDNDNIPQTPDQRSALWTPYTYTYCPRCAPAGRGNNRPSASGLLWSDWPSLCLRLILLPCCHPMRFFLLQYITGIIIMQFLKIYIDKKRGDVLF